MIILELSVHCCIQYKAQFAQIIKLFRLNDFQKNASYLVREKMTTFTYEFLKHFGHNLWHKG